MCEPSRDASSATSDRKKWAKSVIRGTTLCATSPTLSVTQNSYVTGWEHTQITGRNNASTHRFSRTVNTRGNLMDDGNSDSESV